MFRFVLYAVAISAINAGIIEDFVSGGKYINVALKEKIIKPFELGVECSHEFTVTNTGKVDTCKGKSGLPIINFKLDVLDDTSYDAAMIAFDTAEERAAFSDGEILCDESLIKMLIIKPVGGFANLEMISNEAKEATRQEIILATKVPKRKDLENYFSNGFLLKCFED